MSKTCENCIHFCVCVYRDGTHINASCCAFYEQNKRPNGEWIETSNIWETEDLSGWGYWKECSSCHCQEKRRTAFCPNCGSDNRKKVKRND